MSFDYIISCTLYNAFYTTHNEYTYLKIKIISTKNNNLQIKHKLWKFMKKKNTLTLTLFNI